jgi:hypothetical protein
MDAEAQVVTRIQMDDIKRIQMDAKPQVKRGLTSLDNPGYPHPAGRRHTRAQDLEQLDRLIREPGSLAPAPEAVPLHKMAAARHAQQRRQRRT